MATNTLLPVPIRALRQSSNVWQGFGFRPLASASAACRGWQSPRWKNLHTLTVYTPSARSRCIQDKFASHAGCMFPATKPLCGPLNPHRRWSSSKRPDEQMENSSQNPQSGPKKSPILSKIPIPTHENIYTVPNILTFSRLVAAPLVGYFLVHDHHAAALSLFVYAGLTDLVDGYIARRYNLQTVVGTIIDPMADKLLMTIGVACLAVNGSIPVWLAVIILGRDVGLALSAIYYRWISLPPPKTMARYWDFSLPSAEVKPTGISKVNTALQLVLVGSAIALPVIPEAVRGKQGFPSAQPYLSHTPAG
ncbi:hypothetical protein KXW69_001454 [Aspergillus fumigatus]|nr:hypothetical protein KXW69_001454 [Aspergillus fumigatus]